MGDECLICGVPLRYEDTERSMVCVLCGKKEMSNTACEKGHYVCSDCHMRGMDAILHVCLHTESKNPMHILEELMSLPFCHMHGPEHHVMVGSALLAAYRNAGGEIDLPSALHEMMARGKKVPGGACGYWGACGAGVSTGQFMAIVTGSTPLKKEPWKLSNGLTARALQKISEHGGPRCCKRDSYLSLLAAVEYVKLHLDVEMETDVVRCRHFTKNNQCLGRECPFFPGK